VKEDCCRPEVLGVLCAVFANGSTRIVIVLFVLRAKKNFSHLSDSSDFLHLTVMHQWFDFPANAQAYQLNHNRFHILMSEESSMSENAISFINLIII
jgi:hypothetical protein